jgi:hypothetical protein
VTAYKEKSESQKDATRAYAREHQREYRKRPENLLRFQQYTKTYKEKNLEKLREQALVKYRRNRADPIAMARIKENSRKHKVKLKQLVVEKYSNGTMKCALCEEKRLPCLSIDHIDGGGTAHRKSIMVSAGLHFYHWLKREKFPPGFRVLCMNCQFMSLDDMRKRKRELLANQHN